MSQLRCQLVGDQLSLSRPTQQHQHSNTEEATATNTVGSEDDWMEALCHTSLQHDQVNTLTLARTPHSSECQSQPLLVSPTHSPLLCAVATIALSVCLSVFLSSPRYTSVSGASCYGSMEAAASVNRRTSTGRSRVCGQRNAVARIAHTTQSMCRCSVSSHCSPLLLSCQSVHSDIGGCGSVHSPLPRVLDGVALPLSAAERRSVRTALNKPRSESASGVALIGGEWTSGQPNHVTTISEWTEDQQHDTQRMAGQFSDITVTAHTCRADEVSIGSALPCAAFSSLVLCRVVLCCVLCCAVM